MTYLTTPPAQELIAQLPLGSFLANGASAYLNTGAGYQLSFDAASNDEIVGQMAFHQYSGEDLTVSICWQLFSTAPIGGDTVIWEIDYAFVLTGDNAETKVSGTISYEIDVAARTADVLYMDSLPVLTGVANAKLLNLTIRRKSTGAGADTYASAADLFAVKISR